LADTTYPGSRHGLNLKNVSQKNNDFMVCNNRRFNTVYNEFNFSNTVNTMIRLEFSTNQIWELRRK